MQKYNVNYSNLKLIYFCTVNIFNFYVGGLIILFLSFRIHYSIIFFEKLLAPHASPAYIPTASGPIMCNKNNITTRRSLQKIIQ